MKSPNKKTLKFLLKLLITLAFTAWVIFSTSWRDVWLYVSEIKPLYLIAYILFLFLGFWVSSRKWQILANFKGIKLSSLEFFQLYFIGTFINNFMPSFIAGDAYKAYEIGKKNEKYTQAASTVMMDRITGLVAATLLALLFLFFNFQNLVESRILIASAAILLISLSIDCLMPQIRKIAWLKRLVFRMAPEKLVEFLKELGSYNRNSGILGHSVFYSIVFSLIGVGALNYILFLALGIEINILDYLSVIFIISIVSALPISINNIGIKEWAYVTFFGIFALSPAAVLTVAIVSRTIQMLVSLFALPLYLERKK
ncbi:MAG: lysylphosphatidylglycerol synthase transmembrane domain-containing protein [Patescibacteria group bacterium]